MSVIIRLQNLPWSANALDIRNYFRGLSIPEGGVHIVGGELGDAFIAFSTDEDARQAMMLDCGKIKEIQVKLLLSSRSEMHKVIEAARQTVPILSLAPPAPAPAPPPAPVTMPPAITPFSAALGTSALGGFGIPGIGNPNEIPQPAVIEPPAPLVSPSDNDDREEDGRKRSKEKDRRRSRSRSRSRDRDRKDRKRDRRDRSRSRERRRRDRSRSGDRRDRRDRKRDRKDRSRSRERSERNSPRRSRDRRNNDRKSPERVVNLADDNIPAPPPAPVFGNTAPVVNHQLHHIMNNALSAMQTTPTPTPVEHQPANRFNDSAINDTYNKLSELGKKRNPNAFQGEQNGGNRFMNARGGGFRRDGRTRFDGDARDCCVAIRNAPNHTSYGDVRRFFPFLIDKHGIKMINDGTGRRTGNIFVRFCEPRSKQLALQRKNNELKGEQVIVEALDDEAYEAAVDSFLPFRDAPGEASPRPAAPPAPAPAPPAPAAPPCSVLRIAELPLFVKEHDIIKMFSDFSLLSIMLNDCRITRTKTAYVQFVKVDDARMAYERRDRHSFGKRQPVITPITDEEYEKEKALQGERPEFQRPLPAPQQQPQPEPEPEPVAPAAPRDPRQRRAFEPPAPQQAGVPFFAAPFVPAQQPFAAGFPGQQFGGFPGNGGMDPRTAAANWAARPGFPEQQQPVSAPDPEEELDCVLMKGLPCDATDRTIVSFLADTGAVPARIHLMLDPAGVPSGDCFCEFRSVGEARRAAAKHGHTLEGCRVTVDLVPRAVVEDALDGPKHDPRDALLAPPPHDPPYFEPRGGKRGGFRGRGGFDRGGFDRGGFDRGGFDRGFDQGRGSWSDRGRGGFDRGRGGFDRDRGRGRGGFDRGFDRGRGRGRGRGGYENGRDMREEEPDSALEDFGAPGCVLSLENVPFRASVEDILGFFGDFELTPDDVIRRFNERGQPTGDARVAFRTPFDAQRALSTRHLASIQDRRISLSLL